MNEQIFIDNPYLATLRSAFLRLAARNQGGSEQEAMENALTEVLTEWNRIEQIGGLCISWSATDKAVRIAETLESAGLATDSKDFEFAAAPKFFRRTAPFVIDRNEPQKIRIYTNRNFIQEALLASRVTFLAQGNTEPGSPALQKLEDFKKDSGTYRRNPEQEAAIEKSLWNRLSIISGGPGTGKTTTVTKVIEALLADKPDMTVYLTAPTGKAKSRLLESILTAVQRSPLDYPLTKDCIDSNRLQANTIHMWLCTPTSSGARPVVSNPLECDVLIVDEASMIDSQIAYELFNAVNLNKTRVIVLGDMHQLAAVGPGAVFAEISAPDGALKENLSVLRTSHRFDDNQGIGKLAKAVNFPEPGWTEQKHCKHVWEVVAEAKNDKDRVTFDESRVDPNTGLSSGALKWLREHMGGYVDCVKRHLVGKVPAEEDLRAVWKSISSFRALAALRRGEMSVEAVNDFCSGFMKANLGNSSLDDNYCGKVIIVRSNDLSLNVANGDVGFLYKDENGFWTCYLGDTQTNILELLLPQYDVAFAITIHQSQGSGFTNVGIFLPPVSKENDNATALATRELLYTGITRAEKSCVIFGSRESLDTCVARKTFRTGGLASRLVEFKEYYRSLADASKPANEG